MNGLHKYRLPANYIALMMKIRGLYRELNTGNYDRAEITLYGVDIRVWRTVINCQTKVHLGWKNPWEQQYHKTTVLLLVESIYCNRRGNI